MSQLANDFLTPPVRQPDSGESDAGTAGTGIWSHVGQYATTNSFVVYAWLRDYRSADRRCFARI